MTLRTSSKHAAAAFIAICVVMTFAFGGYVAWSRTGGLVTGTPAVATLLAHEALPRLHSQPYMMFRTSARGDTYGQAVIAPVDGADGSRYSTRLACDRVHFAAGRGVCLAADRGAITTYRALTFDDSFTVRDTIPLPGVPSRVRVAPDGRRAGVTVFVSGDSYAPGGFSTRTFIIDTDAGRVLNHLEEYDVVREGRPFKAADFNFWGVTFADTNRFYATLATGGETYLIEGNVDTKRARTLHRGVECPSLSPDGRRIAFKKRIIDGMRLHWRVAVLELATMRETLIADGRSVDDQAEWLDDDRVVYGLPSDTWAASTDLWVAPADGRGAPEVLVRDAWSPAFVRSGK